MNIIINHDLLSSIFYAKEPLGPKKFVITEAPSYALFFSIALGLDSAVTLEPLEAVLVLVEQITLFTMLRVSRAFVEENDRRIKVIHDLIELVPILQENGVNTSYNMLLEAQMYEKKHKLFLNEKKLPQILEQKYIMIPAYTINNEIKEVSVLQEHVIGAKEYVLSLGSPQRKFKLAFAGA